MVFSVKTAIRIEQVLRNRTIARQGLVKEENECRERVISIDWQHDSIFIVSSMIQLNSTKLAQYTFISSFCQVIHSWKSSKRYRCAVPGLSEEWFLLYNNRG